METMKVLLLGGYNYKMPINTYTIPEGSHVHTTQVDFVSRPTQSIVHLVQYDTTLQIIEVALYSDRNKFIIPADADVFMRWSNKDRTFVYPKTLGCNKSRTSIYVEVSDKMTKTYGPSNPIIEISLNGKVAGSQSIPVYVERNPVQSGDVESSDGYKDYMDGVLSQIQNIISSWVAKAIYVHKISWAYTSSSPNVYLSYLSTKPTPYSSMADIFSHKNDTDLSTSEVAEYNEQSAIIKFSSTGAVLNAVAISASNTDVSTFAMNPNAFDFVKDEVIGGWGV